MAYKQFPTDKYIAELQRKANIETFTKPIIQKHNAELRAKVKPTITELPPTASDNDIRLALTNELSKVLKAPDVPNVIENLSKVNDLRSFYRFSKTFLNQIKDIRNLDASFLLDQWSKFKSQMLIQSEREGVVPFQGQTAAEYERATKPYFQRKQDLERPSRIPREELQRSVIKRQSEYEHKSMYPHISSLDTKTRKALRYTTPKETFKLLNTREDRIPSRIQIHGSGIIGQTYLARR